MSVIRKDLIRSVVSVVLNIVAVSCIVTIVVISSNDSDGNIDNDHHLLLMFILVCAGIGRMYLCLPQTVESSRYPTLHSVRMLRVFSRRDSSRALAEQFMTVAGVAPAGEESEHHLHHSQTDLQGFHNHFMSSYYR